MAFKRSSIPWKRTLRQLLAGGLILASVSACSLMDLLKPANLMATNIPEAETVLFPAYQTGTALVGLKYTDAAVMATTLAAAPTNTDTQTVAPTSVYCSPGSISGEVRSNGATGHITFGVALTNVGNSTCIMQGPPDMLLVNKQGIPLDVDVSSFCFQCAEPSAGTPTPSKVSPGVGQTAQAQDVLHRAVSLIPNQRIRVFLIWSNWCHPFPPGGVSIRLRLPQGTQLDMPSDASAAGRCDVENQPSTLQVSEYYY